MLTTKPEKKAEKEDFWKQQVRVYFSSVSLPSEKKANLENLLLNQGKKKKSKIFSWFLNLSFRQYQKRALSYIAVAITAAAITFIFIQENTIQRKDLSFASEIDSLSATATLPPDFNLVGRTDALPQLLEQSLPQDPSFRPIIPKQIAQNYSAYEGRLFQLRGQTGVCIAIEPHTQLLSERQKEGYGRSRASTLLYILKLSEKDIAFFPDKKTRLKITSSTGGVKDISAWREGLYGYAVVNMTKKTPPQN